MKIHLRDIKPPEALLDHPSPHINRAISAGHYTLCGAIVTSDEHVTDDVNEAECGECRKGGFLLQRYEGDSHRLRILQDIRDELHSRPEYEGTMQACMEEAWNDELADGLVKVFALRREIGDDDDT